MIKLNTPMAGADFSYAQGEEVTLEKDTEARLVESGQAEYVNGTTDKRTSKRAGKPRGRKKSSAG